MGKPEKDRRQLAACIAADAAAQRFRQGHAWAQAGAPPSPDGNNNSAT